MKQMRLLWSCIGVLTCIAALSWALGSCATSPPVPPRQPVRQAADIALDKIIFLDPMQVISENFPLEASKPWIKEIEQLCQRMGHRRSERRDVLIQVTLHRQRPPEYDVAARPALPAEQHQAYRAALGAVTPLHTQFFDISFQLLFNVNEGSANEKEAFVPALRDPLKEQYEQFKRASTAEQLRELRRWAWDEVLPYLAHRATKVDARFAGMRSLGAAVRGLKTLPPAITPLTTQSAAFWRAGTEMARGDQLVAALYIFLRVAGGEFDYAQRLLGVLLPFSNKETPADVFLHYLKARLDAFYGPLHAGIQGGIALNDQQKYSEAIAVFERVLAQHPRSGWARYERFLSLRLWKGERAVDWDATSQDIYADDPLFATETRARTGREAYLLVRRRELPQLLHDPKRIEPDYLTYADISLELGVYDVAALMYWQALSLFKPELHGGRDLLARFLYCLEKLGVKEVQSQFQGDFGQRFRSLERELLQQMKASPAFKMMQRKF